MVLLFHQGTEYRQQYDGVYVTIQTGEIVKVSTFGFTTVYTVSFSQGKDLWPNITKDRFLESKEDQQYQLGDKVKMSFEHSAKNTVEVLEDIQKLADTYAKLKLLKCQSKSHPDGQVVSPPSAYLLVFTLKCVRS